MTTREPYFTIYNEVPIGGEYRWTANAKWATKRPPMVDMGGTRFVEVRPCAIMVPVDADVLERLIDDSEERSTLAGSRAHELSKDGRHEPAPLGRTVRTTVTSYGTETPLSYEDRNVLRDSLRTATDEAAQ